MLKIRYKVTNISGYADLGINIDLYTLAKESNISNVSYEPEFMPGVTIRFPEATARLYKNGKVIIVGAKTEEAIRIVLERLVEEVKPYIIYK